MAMDDNIHTPLLGEEQPVQPKPSWWNTPSPYVLYPLSFLRLLALTMVMVSEQNVLVGLACNMHYGREMNYKDPLCHITDIQKKVSSWEAVMVLMDGAIAMMIVPPVSSQSDRYGRKTPLYHTLIFGFLTFLVSVLAVWNWRSVTFAIIIVPYMLSGFSGHEMMTVVATSSYIADCVSPEERSKQSSMVMASGLAGGTIGPMLVGYVCSQVDDVLAPYYMVLCTNLICMIYVALIPESLTWDQMARNRLEYEKSEWNRRQQGDSQSATGTGTRAWKWGRTLIETLNFSKNAKTIWRIAAETSEESPLIRRNILMLTVCEIMHYGGIDFRVASSYLYFQLKYDWTSSDLGFFTCVTFFVRMLILSIVVPVVLKVLKHVFNEPQRVGVSKAELTIIRVGFFAEVVVTIAFALVTSGLQTYIVGLFECVGGVSRPIIQALLLNIVPQAQLGSFLGSKGAIVLLCQVLLRTSGLAIYSCSVRDIPSLIFYVGAAVYAFALGISCSARPLHHIHAFT